jgi:glutamate carboxypeptidase
LSDVDVNDMAAKESLKREKKPGEYCMKNEDMKKIADFLDGKRDEMLGMIERLVNIDSGTYCKEGVEACGGIIARELENLGFKTSVVPEEECGNHIRAERPGKGNKSLFLSAHLDTVFPEGTATSRPFGIQDGLAYGPGVGDMKGGIVQMLYALKAIRELGLESPPITVFLTADEETGSVRGRPHIEEIARRSSWVLVMEPSSMPYSVGVRRWGLGSFYLTVHGKAAHVLKPDSDGVNACKELALKILALEALSDSDRGVKVSVNLVRGGRSRQVTAAEARADIDVRFRYSALMSEVEEKVREVASTPALPGVRIELEGKLTRPPLEPNPGTETLLRLAFEAASGLDMDLNAIEEYGGSDGCFTSSLGVATLDGLGPLTMDMCGDEERIEIASLTPRAALLAGIISRLPGIDEPKV